MLPMKTTRHQANESDPDAPVEQYRETLSDVSGEHVAQVTTYDQDGNVINVDRPIEELADALDESPSTEGKGKQRAAEHDHPKGHHDNPQPPGEGATRAPEDSVDAKAHEPVEHKAPARAKAAAKRK